MNNKKEMKNRFFALIGIVCMVFTLLTSLDLTVMQAASVPKLQFNKWSKLSYYGGTQKYDCVVKKSGYVVASIDLINYSLDEEAELDYTELNPPKLTIKINKRGSKKYDFASADMDSGVITTGPIKLTKGDVLRVSILSEDGVISQAKCKVKIFTCKRALNYTYLNETQGTFISLELAGAPKNKVTWESTDEAVAEVTSKGMVNTLGVGDCEIIATYKGVEYVCKVVVYYNPEFDSEGDDGENDSGADDNLTDEEWESLMD